MNTTRITLAVLLAAMVLTIAAAVNDAYEHRDSEAACKIAGGDWVGGHVRICFAPGVVISEAKLKATRENP